MQLQNHKQKMIYLDNAATTPVDPEVATFMDHVTTGYTGNASSMHSAGTASKELLDASRDKMASLLNCRSEEIVFTGSGTEANNLAIKGTAFANAQKGNHIIVSAIEHDCVLNAVRWLEKIGFSVTFLNVDKKGLIDLEMLERSITGKTFLISAMHVNNEIGTIEPVREIGRMCRERNIWFHSDACQSFGKIPVDVSEMNVDLLTINAHKIHGPKGVGALYIRKGLKLEPLLHGGGQEGGHRSSTENLAGIAAFVKAAEIACNALQEDTARISALQQKIISVMENEFEGVYFNGSLSDRVPYNVNFCIGGLEGEGIRLQLLLDEAGVCVSTGSACSSNTGNNPSHVLQAIGLNPFQARGGIRITLGRFTTEEEIDRFLEILKEKVMQLTPIF